MEMRASETEFSYAAPEDGALKRFVTRAIEHLTGQRLLWRLYQAYAHASEPRADYWSAAMGALELAPVIDRGSLDNIPREGPLILVANHPFGVIDGIVLTHLVSQRRADFRLLVNAVLTAAPEVNEWLLPIDFADTADARRASAKSRGAARAWLSGGGALIVFPSNTVSTSPRLGVPALDPDWQPFVATLALRTQARVVPVYFAGENSALFQVASHISMTLRLALLFHEVARRIGSEIHLSIGDAIAPEELARFGDRAAIAARLRELTYALGGRTEITPSPKLAAIAASRSGPRRSAPSPTATP